MKKWLKIISVFELVGGILGIVIVLIVLISSQTTRNDMPTIILISAYFIYAFALAMYLLSIIAALLLWQDKKAGYILSIIIQVIQIPHIETSTFFYNFVSGAQILISLGIRPDGGSFNFGGYIGSTLNISLYTPLNGVTIGLNILAIAVVILLFRLMAQKNRAVINENVAQPYLEPYINENGSGI